MSLQPLHYMQRCFQLAQLGLGSVSPNPLVGAVLVYENNIIGEGYHQEYGQAHAEVNCFNSVAERFKPFIPAATLFVNLEPCAHFGKTPPCANRIIEEGVKKVVIANRDPFAEVDGRGIKLMHEAGVTVSCGLGEEQGKWINRRFFTRVTKHRPFIILKWAESADGFIGRHGERVAVSNNYFNRMVHKWRGEEDAIMIGANTLRNDDPLLTNRHWPGKQPLRIVIARRLTSPSAKLLTDNAAPVIVFNEVKQETIGTVSYIMLPKEQQLTFIMNHLYELNIGSILVEGGATLHTAFIEQQLYDEVRVVKHDDLRLQHGVRAASIPQHLRHALRIGNNAYYQWPLP